MPNRFIKTAFLHYSPAMDNIHFGFSNRMIFEAGENPAGSEKPAEKPKTPHAPEKDKTNPFKDVKGPNSLEEINQRERDKIIANRIKSMATLINVGKTPKSEVAGQKPASAEEKAKAVSPQKDVPTDTTEAKEKIQPLTGKAFLATLKEAEEKDKTSGVPLKTRVARTLERMKALATEQASIGNVSYETTKVPFEYEENGKKIKITLGVAGKISIGPPGDSIDIPADGPLAKIIAGGAGGILPTRQVMNAFEKEILKTNPKGQLSFTAGPTLAAKILSDHKKDDDLDPQIKKLLTDWTKGPPHPPAPMMQWLGMFEAAQHVRQEARSTLKGIGKYGDTKAPVMDHRQQEGGSSDTLSLWGAVVNGQKLQNGEGFPHNRSHLDYSQFPAAVVTCEIESDGSVDQYDFKDVLKGGKITSKTGKEVNIGNAYQLFTAKPIDYSKIYADIKVTTSSEKKAPSSTPSTSEPKPSSDEVVKTSPDPLPTSSTPPLQPISEIKIEPSAPTETAEKPYRVAVGAPIIPDKPSFHSSGTSSFNALPVSAGDPFIPVQEVGAIQEAIPAQEPLKEPATPESMPSSLDIPKGKKFFLLGDSHTDLMGTMFKQNFGKEKITHLHSERNNYKMSQSQNLADLEEIYSKQIDGHIPDEELEGSTVAIVIGTNDLFIPKSFSQIKNELTILCNKLRGKGMKIVLATIPPVGDNPGVTPAIIQEHQKLNKWIRGETVDGEKRDPALIEQFVDLETPFLSASDKTKINPTLKGTTLHLSHKGYEQATAIFANKVNHLNQKTQVA